MALYNETLRRSIASAGALKILLDVAKVSTNDDQLCFVLMALSSLSPSASNARSLAQLGAGVVMDEIIRTRSGVQKTYATSVLQALIDSNSTHFSSAKSSWGAASSNSPHESPAALVYDGPVNEHTQFGDLIRVLQGRDTNPWKLALQWLYRFPMETFTPSIKETNAVAVLSDITMNRAVGVRLQLYAFGCLWSMDSCTAELDETAVSRLKGAIERPSADDMRGLFQSMHSVHPVEERLEAMEVLTCLQLAVGGDLGFVEFFPHILAAFGSQQTSLLAPAAVFNPMLGAFATPTNPMVGAFGTQTNQMLGAFATQPNPMLGAFGTQPNPMLVTAACDALSTLASELPMCCVTMVERGVLPLLLQCLVGGGQRAKVLAVKALGSIARSNERNQTRVALSGAIQMLAALVHRGTKQQKVFAASALGSIADKNAIHQDMITASGGIGPLIDLIRSDDFVMAGHGAFALSSLCNKSDSSAYAIVSLGAVPPLIDLLGRKEASIAVFGVVSVLRELIHRPSLRPTLVQLGVKEAAQSFAHVSFGEGRAVADVLLRDLEQASHTNNQFWPQQI